jgi:DoxX-like family
MALMKTISERQRWAGRIVSGIAVAFLSFDAAGKLLKVAPVVEGSMKLGYAESTIFPIGVLLLLGVVLYVIPRTSVFGAIYLAAYLGGAVATHVRVGSPLPSHVLFPVYVAAFLWGGLALRNPRVLALVAGRQ